MLVIDTSSEPPEIVEEDDETGLRDLPTLSIDQLKERFDIEKDENGIKLTGKAVQKLRVFLLRFHLIHMEAKILPHRQDTHILKIIMMFSV